MLELNRVYSFDRNEIENTSIEAHVAIDQPPSILISKQSSMSQSGGMPEEREGKWTRLLLDRQSICIRWIRPDRAAIDKYRDEPGDFTRKVRLK